MASKLHGHVNCWNCKKCTIHSSWCHHLQGQNYIYVSKLYHKNVHRGTKRICRDLRCSCIL